MKMTSLHNLVKSQNKNDKEANKEIINSPKNKNIIDPVYATIMGIIAGLEQTQVISKSRGYCLGISDLMYKTLTQEGIPARIVECKLSILFTENPEMVLIGHNDSGFELNRQSDDEMSTHVVLITETETPYLIDLSIGHIDPKIPYIVEKLNTVDDTEIPCISKFEFPTSIWTYHEKENKLLPRLHQKSILNRIKTDNEFTKTIKTFRLILVGLSAITVLNFIRGAYDFHQKYINKTNGFGPQKTLVK